MIIADVLKPQGIKGEIKVKNYLDSFADVSDVKEVVLSGKTYAVEKYRLDGPFAYIKLAGVEDRNAAELLRGAEVSAEGMSRPKPGKGRYFITDIIGCKIVAAGVTLGTVTDVIQNGGADVYQVDGDKPFLFASVEGVIVSYDIPAKTLTADPAELEKVAVYED